MTIDYLQETSQTEKHQERVPVSELRRRREAAAVNSQGGVCLTVADPVKWIVAIHINNVRHNLGTGGGNLLLLSPLHLGLIRVIPRLTRQ